MGELEDLRQTIDEIAGLLEQNASGALDDKATLEQIDAKVVSFRFGRRP